MPPVVRAKHTGTLSMRHFAFSAAAAAAATLASPAIAQDSPPLETSQTAPATEPGLDSGVFAGDWISIGVGAGYSPSYDGSDDYVTSILPIVQGSLGGVDINPRPGGLALDFIPDRSGEIGIDAGVAARLRRNRASDIKDPVVASLGELKTAIEVGPTAGVSIPGVLHGYDSLSFSTDVRWDVAGAHKGMVIDPSVTYFTPLSRGAIASFSLSAEYVDGDYADYYYSIDAADSLASGLSQFDAGSGFTKVGANLLVGYDLDGDALNGGLALIGIGGYSRMVGDAKDTPFTSDRGSADQWFVAGGIGYTF